jgi:hypothetical protein
MMAAFWMDKLFAASMLEVWNSEYEGQGGDDHKFSLRSDPENLR